jgi:hypothetical protein
MPKWTFIKVLKNSCFQVYSSMHSTRRPFYFVFWISLFHTQVAVYCNAAKSWILTNSMEQTLLEEKLPVPQTVKKFPALLCSQQLNTHPCPKPDQYSPCTPSIYIKDPF